MRATCIALAITAACATPALAAVSCDTVAMTSVQSSYVLQDIGVVAEDGPVFQSSVGLNCSNGLSFEIWTSTALDAKGSYGSRGYGDEIDFSVGYTHMFGRFQFDLGIAYYIVADFSNFHDDLIQGYVTLGYPIKASGITVTPYVRLQQWLGTPDFQDTTFVRTGAQIGIPIADKWSLSGDASVVHEFDQRRNIFRAAVSVGHDFGDGINGSVTGKFTSHAPALIAVGFTKKL